MQDKRCYCNPEVETLVSEGLCGESLWSHTSLTKMRFNPGSIRIREGHVGRVRVIYNQIVARHVIGRENGVRVHFCLSTPPEPVRQNVSSAKDDCLDHSVTRRWLPRSPGSDTSPRGVEFRKCWSRRIHLRRIHLIGVKVSL